MNSFALEHMEQTRDELIRMIESLSDEEFNEKEAPDKWSIAQICHHLVLVELSSVKVVKWGLKNGTDVGNERKDLTVMVDRSIKTQAPDIVRPSDERYEVQQMIEMFTDAREHLLKTIQDIEDVSQLGNISVKHPALGPLSLEQWIEYLPYHEQRHMKQIQEIRG